MAEQSHARASSEANAARRRLKTLAWPQALSLGWLLLVTIIALVSFGWELWRGGGDAAPASLAVSADSLWRWWFVATRNSVGGTLVVVGASLVVGLAAAAAAAFGPWWIEASLTRALELAGALPNIIVVGLWLITHPEDAVAAVIVVVAVQRTLETAHVAALALRALDRQRRLRPRAPSSPRPLGRLRSLLPMLRPLMATTAAHGASSLFALQAAVVFLGLAPAHDATWAGLLGRAARGAADLDASVLALAILSTCTVTLSLYAVAALPEHFNVRQE